MHNKHKQTRWRFNLRTLIVVVFILCALFAANLSPGKPQMMFHFNEADGGGLVYGVYYGWPVPYLRLPTGDYARLPADFFMPGLIVDLGVAALLIATIPFVGIVLRRIKARRQSAATHSC